MARIEKNFKIEEADFNIIREHKKLGIGVIIPPKKGGCTVRPSATLDLTSNITLSNDVLVQEDVKIFTHKHDWSDHRKRRKGHEIFIKKDLFIGEDVFIGANSIILCIDSIGRGAVIGAGSVVTKNIGPYEIWAGNPAKLIKVRGKDVKNKK